MLVKRLGDYYAKARLSEEQEQVLRNWDARGTRWLKPAKLTVHVPPGNLAAAE